MTCTGLLRDAVVFLLLMPGVTGNIDPREGGRSEQHFQEVQGESYAVYSDLVRQRYSRWFKDDATVRISALTQFRLISDYEPVAADCRQQLDAKASETALLNRWISANATRHRIEPKLSLPGRYVLVTDKVRTQPSREPGIIRFSEVAFSADRLHAMVWVSNYCGELCGTGLLWTLAKKDNKWVVATEHPICGYVS